MSSLSCFIAGPYHRDQSRNIDAAQRIAQAIARGGNYPYRPHLSENALNLPGHNRQFASWRQYALDMMARCDCVVMCNGWQQYPDCQEQHEVASKAGMPVYDSLVQFIWSKSLGEAIEPLFGKPLMPSLS